MKLYSFPYSSASFRVRCALALKVIAYETIEIDLQKGAHLGDEYRAINPQGRVPFLIDGEIGMAQSLAILEYLEEKYPNPPILPKDIVQRQRARAFSHVIASDIFPLQNLSTRKKLGSDFEQTAGDQAKWSAFWIERGFKGLEAELALNPPQTEFLFENYPTVADICLFPQWNNAIRYECDLSQFPILASFYDKLKRHEAFIAAIPNI